MSQTAYFSYVLECDILCQKLELCSTDLWQRKNMNMDLCFGTNYMKLLYKFWTVENFLCEMWSTFELKFIQCRTVIHSLYQASGGTRRNIHQVQMLNWDFIVPVAM